MNVFWAAAAACGMGALHSLEPGHGKGVLTAYLVSSRARIRDALVLGVMSAVAHTASIVVLSLTAMSAVRTLVPERLTLWIELVSGLLIVLIGTRMMYRRRHPRTVTIGKIGRHETHRDDCDHHGHSHSHHHHVDETPSSLSRLLLIGFLTGIVPCPSAVAILLAALGSGQMMFGVQLVAAFSIGSAFTMCTVGLLVVRASRYAERLEARRFLQAASSFSSLLIVLLGGIVALKSLLLLG